MCASSHISTSINIFAFKHTPTLEQIHIVVSMNMRRVTSVLIVHNDCSHGPSPCSYDAVPLSIIVAAPSITLHTHSHCWALHTHKHTYNTGKNENKYTLKVFKDSSWLIPVFRIWLYVSLSNHLGNSMTSGSKETTFQIKSQSDMLTLLHFKLSLLYPSVSRTRLHIKDRWHTSHTHHPLKRTRTCTYNHQSVVTGLFATY